MRSSADSLDARLRAEDKLSTGDAPWDMISLKAALNKAHPGASYPSIAARLAACWLHACTKRLVARAGPQQRPEAIEFTPYTGDTRCLACRHRRGGEGHRDSHLSPAGCSLHRAAEDVCQGAPVGEGPRGVRIGCSHRVT